MLKIMLTFCGLGITQPALLGQSQVNVGINTTALIGHAAGPFYFGIALTSGSNAGNVANVVRVSNISLHGGTAIGNATGVGGASGSLGNGITIRNGSSLSLITESFLPGPEVSFLLSLGSTDDKGGFPSRITVFILDRFGTPIPTKAQAGDYFLGIDLPSRGPVVDVHASDPARLPGAGGPILIAAPSVFFTDSTPPVIVPQIYGTLGKNGWYRSAVRLVWSSSDPESGIKLLTGCEPTNLTAETTAVSVTCSATNGAGLSSSMPVTIKIDRTPPTILGMPVNDCMIWPVDQKLVTVATIDASDGVSGVDLASLKITVLSDEPIPVTDPKFPDIVITPNTVGGYTVQLRADRFGNTNDRIYRLTAAASDQAGNTAIATATCTVPHDQRK